MTEIDLAFVDELAERVGGESEKTIPLLQGLQEHYGWLPAPAMERLCEITHITPAQLHGVSTFYEQFRHRPVGRHIINVCVGTACHVKGAPAVHDAVHEHLKIAAGRDTDDEGLFTVQKIACLGCCTLAPVVQIDGVTYGHLTPGGIGPMLRDFLELDARGGARKPRPRAIRADGDGAEIRIALDSCCIARGSGRVHEAIQQALARSSSGSRA